MFFFIGSILFARPRARARLGLSPMPSLLVPFGEHGVRGDDLAGRLACQETHQLLKGRGRGSCPWQSCALRRERTFGGVGGHGRSRSAASCGIRAVLRLSAGRSLRHHFMEVVIILEFAAVQVGQSVARPV